jgi:peptidoglycan hydrolase-like protein with peptidoglycan-binding domain
VQARLHNLGFLAGAGSGTLDDATTAAVRRFQQTVLGREDADGALDDETLSKLVAEHGC